MNWCKFTLILNINAWLWKHFSKSYQPKPKIGDSSDNKNNNIRDYINFPWITDQRLNIFDKNYNIS